MAVVVAVMAAVEAMRPGVRVTELVEMEVPTPMWICPQVEHGTEQLMEEAGKLLETPHH